MTKKRLLPALALIAIFALPHPALASSIVVSLGNTAPTNPFDGGAPLVSGNTYGSAVYTSNFVAPFFTDFCGSESDPFANCDMSWTFNYVIPVGETITAASLTLALADIDSASTG